MLAVERGREGTGERLPAVATYDATSAAGSPALGGFAQLPSHLSAPKRRALVSILIPACRLIHRLPSSQIIEQLSLSLGSAAAALIEFHDTFWFNDEWAGGCVASLPKGEMGPEFASLLRFISSH